MNDRSARLWFSGVAAVAVLTFLSVTWRDAGTFAHTFADERTYSYHARAMPLAEAPLPSYLYFFVFSSTQSCGDGALACARLLNAIFFALALPLIFLVARRYTSDRLAFFVATVIALSSFNTYTAYFMPESMYFFGVWCLLCLLTVRDVDWRMALGIGVTVGLLSLVKLHGLFLLPSALLTLVLRLGLSGRWRNGLTLGALAVALAVIVRFGGGFLFAGTPGLSILGTLYASQGDSGAGRTLGEILTLARGVGWRHLQAVVVLYALPIALVLRGTPVRAPHDPRLLNSTWLAVLFVVPLMLMTALFTARVSGQGPYEFVTRLHMRYYNFLLPLLLIVASGVFISTGPRQLVWRRALAAGVVVGIGIFALVTLSSNVTTAPCDCPEMLAMGQQSFTAAMALGLLSVAAWTVHPRWGAALWLFAAMPLTTLIGSHAANAELASTQQPSVFDTAAQITRSFLGPEAIDHLQVVVPHAVGGYRVLFTLNNKHGSFEVNQGDRPITFASPERDLYLLIGKFTIEGAHRVVLETPEYSLIRFE